MSREEFKNTKFTGGMVATFKGKEYDVVYADFEDFVIGLDMGGLPTDVICEDIEKITLRD